MNNSKLKIGFGDYDRTRNLADGSIKIEGVEASFKSYRIVTEVFEAMVRDRAFDIAELGLSYFLRTMDFDDPPFLALPVPLVRCFRHSAIYVNVNSGIRKPEDLAGKTIGEFAMYGHDAGVWPKGILADDFGVTPDQCRWIIGSLDWPMKPVDFVPQPHPANVDVTFAPQGTDLGKMLEEGKIDALIAADVPKCYLDKSPKVARLFADHEATEREYFQRTGIFPIMHLVAVRRELAMQPELMQAVYKGFCEAKDAIRQQQIKGMVFNNMATMVPWLSRLLDENISLMGEDWWPYGLEANRKTIDTFLRYHFEQGLSKRHLTCEEIFAPGIMHT
ncbi:4,5-dihydroxyphthalate decarboxylase [Silvibacterium acidisoli]|uniref:4,5-dihydroxyphthalate decarboxylase n=1 Tax=Acidobacteriaceae bacterium ZG23-2 TaxID=2883246 RepID=UPI00406CF911